MDKNFEIPTKYYPLSIFLAFAAIVTVLCGTMYFSIQHVYRSNADDPQVEAASEITQFINQGAPLEAIVDDTRNTDMENSLSTFVMIFDSEKQLVGASASLNGETPTPPIELFEQAKQRGGEYRITWEPKENVRIASVIKVAENDAGYVLVGRNLKEVEARFAKVTNVIGIGWIGLLLLSGILTWLFTKILANSGSVTIVEEEIVVSNTEESVDPDNL